MFLGIVILLSIIVSFIGTLTFLQNVTAVQETKDGTFKNDKVRFPLIIHMLCILICWIPFVNLISTFLLFIYIEITYDNIDVKSPLLKKY